MLRVMSQRTLASLAVGEAGAVVAIEGGGSLTIRLAEMGFVTGTSVRMVKIAPMGDPLQFVVRGYHISLRRSEAARITIE
jgi:Fe2+ transport system protein FeoA